jgi:hypothetical protein
MQRYLIPLFGLILSSEIASARPTGEENTAATKQFAQMLVGTFDSSAQSIDDSEYLDVTVHHCSVQVSGLPEELREGEFLALRQSVSTAANPYRVRVLRVFQGESDSNVRVSSFAPQQGVNLAQLCSLPESDRTVDFSQLTGEKCTTSATLIGAEFVGGTTGEGCPSNRAGSVRMTSELTLSSNKMTTWDRGWTADGKLAWGPEKGPYQFEKVQAQDPRIAQFAAFFSGRFSNAEQVEKDPKNFTPVEYRFCQIDVGGAPVRPDTRLMFAEQRVSVPGRVIERRRIYEFFRDENAALRVRTNPFNESDIPAGVCDLSLAERRSLPASILNERDTCLLTFDWNEDSESFEGGTPAEGCPSQFQGAVKLTIEEVIKDGLIQPWERWFNAAGEQVAGSKAGPYIYKRN